MPLHHIDMQLNHVDMNLFMLTCNLFVGGGVLLQNKLHSHMKEYGISYYDFEIQIFINTFYFKQIIFDASL